MADVPHFDLPFRFTGSDHVAVVEQDSFEDIRNCVQAILLTRQGQRLEIPDFGIVDPVFENQPLQTEHLINAVLASEPRAHVFFEQQPDAFDALVAQVSALLSLTEEVSR